MVQLIKETKGRILNVAVVGAGEVAMTTHLPTLMLCSDMFRTVALVDISRGALAHCAAKFHIPRTFTDVGEMLETVSEVDVVMIINATEYHAIHAIQCLNAGKHVLIEKPMALCHADARAIDQAQQKSGKVVFVGFMRRYATAFLRVKDLLREMPRDQINYVRVRDIIGQNSFFVDQSGSFPVKFSDFPPEAGREKQIISKPIYTQALGDRAANPRDVATWGLLTGLGSHDLSAMRELIGMPKRVLSATRSPNGLFMTVIFQYDGFACCYEMGIDHVRKFDAHIEIDSEFKRFRVTYDTPYVKGLPITATILSSRDNGDHSEEVVRPTYEDSYTLEYKAFYNAVVNGHSTKTTAMDSDEDLQIFDMIMSALVDV